MAEDRHFHFEGTEDMSDSQLLLEDAGNRRLEKLNRRVTVLTILLPCLVGLLLYYGYRDLASKMNHSRDSGVQEVQKLGEDILSRFEQLTANIENLENSMASAKKSLAEMRTSIEQNAAASDTAVAAAKEVSTRNAEAIDRLETAVSELRDATQDKADFAAVERELQGAIDPLKKDISSLGALKEEIQALAPLREEIGSLAEFRTEIEAVSNRLAALENSLGKDLSAFATYVEKTNDDLDKIQSSISALSRDKIGEDKLRLELLKTQKQSRLTLLQEITKLQKSLNAIQDRIFKLERSSSRSSNLTPPAEILRPPTVSRSGRVREQELTE